MVNYQKLMFIDKKNYKAKDWIDYKDNLLCQKPFCIYTILNTLKNRSRNRFCISIQVNPYLNSTF